MKHIVAYMFIASFGSSLSSHFVQELAELDRKILELLDDLTLRGIEVSIHYMNLYCMEIRGLSMKLDSDVAEDIIKDLIKLYKQGRPKFFDIELNEYDVKNNLLAKEELLTRFKLLQLDARSAWDEFVTSLVKKSPNPI